VIKSLGEMSAHAIATTVGLAMAWLIVGQAWVEFDSLLPMWVAAAGTVGVALASLLWRPRYFFGLATGLIVSAVVCTTIFSLLSSGPSID
jgi:hypothetical protein